MVDSLNDIHQFLDDNPGEVVILFIEPYVSPQDIEQVFKEAGGLDQMAAVLDRNAPLPTLGQLVRPTSGSSCSPRTTPTGRCPGTWTASRSSRTRLWG